VLSQPGYNGKALALGSEALVLAEHIAHPFQPCRC